MKPGPGGYPGQALPFLSGAKGSATLPHKAPVRAHGRSGAAACPPDSAGKRLHHQAYFICAADELGDFGPPLPLSPPDTAKGLSATPLVGVAAKFFGPRMEPNPDSGVPVPGR